MYIKYSYTLYVYMYVCIYIYIYIITMIIIIISVSKLTLWIRRWSDTYLMLCIPLKCVYVLMLFSLLYFTDGATPPFPLCHFI